MLLVFSFKRVLTYILFCVIIISIKGEKGRMALPAAGEQSRSAMELRVLSS